MPQPPTRRFALLQAWFLTIPPVILGLVVLCALPEIVLSGADFGLWGGTQWRGVAYGLGGFWPGLLHDWRPNFSGQAAVMFFSYGFLHGGLMHLAVNMISLVSLGGAVVDRVGQGRFLAIYGAALLGGGLGFGLLANTAQPMVGASGALFGLAGALVAWGLRDRYRAGETLWPVAKVLIWLVALNLILWVAMAGSLAWQTHLGGFLAGAALAWGLAHWEPELSDVDEP
ncbi:MAG: rhomboid family intramembrane serine protease [Cypionkella sp.]